MSLPPLLNLGDNKNARAGRNFSVKCSEKTISLAIRTLGVLALGRLLDRS
jgi:hypothetical protein